MRDFLFLIKLDRTLKNCYDLTYLAIFYYFEGTESGRVIIYQ